MTQRKGGFASLQCSVSGLRLANSSETAVREKFGMGLVLLKVI